MRLIIGNKNNSSWFLRPWLAMKVAGIAFEERRIPLYGPGSNEKILAFSPACRAYADAILTLPAMQDWMAAANTETESLPQFELYG